MNKTIFAGTVLFVAASVISGCELVAGIFKAGVWVGVLAVVAIVAAIIWAISRLVS
jgi:hypothetical protein